jgi:hypothetical protein
MKRFLSAVAIAATFAAFAACSGSKSATAPYGSGDPNLGAPGVTGSVSPFLTDGQAVIHGLDAIAARSGQPLRVTQVTVNAAGGLIVDVRDAARHGLLSRFMIASNGKILGPIPVQLVSGGVVVSAADIQRMAFDPKAVPFARLARVEREAITMAKLPNLRVTQWDVGGLGPHSRRVMLLENDNGRRIVVFDPQFHVARIHA